MLQNSVILLVIQVQKNPKIHFVGNLILNMTCEFYYDGVTAIMTLFTCINIEYGDVAAEVIP